MATVRPRSAKPVATISSRVGPVEKSVEPKISASSPRAVVGGLGVGSEPGHDLQLAVPHAGGHLELGQLGVVIAEDDRQLRLERAPEPNGLLTQLGRVGQHPPDGLRRDRGRPHALQLRRWARQDEHRRPGAPLERRHDQPRRGPDRVQDRRAAGRAPASGRRPLTDDYKQ